MKRILLVDDEPRILSGLQRQLRPMRAWWDLHYAAGAQAALDAMNDRDFDVLITDMRMPDIDGPELLMRARARSPGTICIVLSGYADFGLALRAIPYAHRFLSKPCDSGELQRILERLCALDELVPDASSRSVLVGMNGLALAPRTQTAVRGLLADSTPDVDRVVDFVHDDIGLALKVFQLSCSPLFGPSHALDGVRQAVVHLGVRPVLEIGSAMVAVELLDDSARRSALASSSRAAFLANVGTVAIASAGASVSRLASDDGPTADDDATLGNIATLDPGKAAAFLFDLWGLPSDVQERLANPVHRRESEMSLELRLV